MPCLTLISLKRAQAQVEVGPVWAIVEFADLAPTRIDGLGAAASAALGNELARTNRYDIVPADTVNRTVSELGYENPLTKEVELVRLGQALRASTIVSGELINYRVVPSGTGRVAEVKMRVIVRDVASGLPINGSALLAASGVRTGDVTDETLIAEAINAAAFKAVQDIQTRTLPTATVLNTLERQALVNQGARSGFTNGQDVIIIRGREQVARGEIFGVEPDSAFVRIRHQTKGVQPGDRVRVVFDVPTIRVDFGRPGESGVVQPRRPANASAVVTLLLVAGLLFLLLGQGRGASTNVLTDVTAEPYLTPDNRMGVGVKIRADAFVPATTRVQWQLWRSDVQTGPVVVQTNPTPYMTDEGRAGETFSWFTFPVVGSIGVNCPALPGGLTATGRSLVSGVPYMYSVELVFSIDARDDPNAGGGGGAGGGGIGGGGIGGGGTGGGGTGGRFSEGAPIDYAQFSFEEAMFQGNGGGTGGGGGGTGGGGGGTGGGGGGTGGGTGPGQARCYGITTRIVAHGSATPFQWGADALRAPDNVAVTTAPVFRFDSMRASGQIYTLEYALQFSPQPTFPGNQTVTVHRFFDTGGVGIVSTPPVPEALTAFPGTRRLYWRVGVRNVGDSPGPSPVNGERYIFSGPKFFDRPALPPDP